MLVGTKLALSKRLALDEARQQHRRSRMDTGESILRGLCQPAQQPITDVVAVGQRAQPLDRRIIAQIDNG